MKFGITTAALGQIRDLLRFYAEKGRPEAGRRLLTDLAQARRLIQAEPGGGLTHPRPFPDIALLNLRWILVRVYWIAWTIVDGRPVIANVLYAAGDVQGRAALASGDILDWQGDL